MGAFTSPSNTDGRGRNEVREGGKKKEREKIYKKKINRGVLEDEEGGRTNPLDMQATYAFHFRYSEVFISVSRCFNFPFHHHACLKFGLFLNKAHVG